MGGSHLISWRLYEENREAVQRGRGSAWNCLWTQDATSTLPWLSPFQDLPATPHGHGNQFLTLQLRLPTSTSLSAHTSYWLYFSGDLWHSYKGRGGVKKHGRSHTFRPLICCNTWWVLTARWHGHCMRPLGHRQPNHTMVTVQQAPWSCATWMSCLVPTSEIHICRFRRAHFPFQGDLVLNP